MSEVLWRPPTDVRTSTHLGAYLGWLAEHGHGDFADYDALWRWSVADVGRFWSTVWDAFGVASATPPGPALGREEMPGAVWFPGATLNYAGHALRTSGGHVAIVARSQGRPPVELTWDELRDRVASCRHGLVGLGVGRGDRVVAYLPNGPEAVVALLAVASLGAVWASCPPEFGVRSVVDRFGQLDPVCLLASSGYRYGAKLIDRSAELAQIRAALPSLCAVVDVPSTGTAVPGAVAWDDLLRDSGPLEFDPVPFDHPLYVLFSSGTTGLPKAIVHGHGGILLEHLKALALHQDLGPSDRFFWYSTTGWMMWNFLVSGLLVGATIVLYDGDPGHPDLGNLWRLADETAITAFGVSAPFLMNCRRSGVAVGRLPALRSIGSTGAPLPAEGFRWVYEQLPDVWLTSISGGTDVCTAFVGGSPWRPVVAGEISCRYLGARVEAFDEDGRSVVGEEGELVITAPLPSMPVRFWADDGSRYRAAYFARFAGVWSHGDWVTITDRGTCVISGRSDATLNRGGVRLGTGELYSVVESIDGVVDSLVVHLEGDAGGRLILLVQLAPGMVLDDELRTRIGRELRTQLSPRHAPDEVYAVGSIPRTHSGKKLEVPVKRILGGARPDAVLSPGALMNPEAVAEVEAIARSRA